MVDPHDNKTMQLPLPVRKARARLFDFFVYRDVAQGFHRGVSEHVNQQGCMRLMELGGLMGAW